MVNYLQTVIYEISKHKIYFLILSLFCVDSIFTQNNVDSIIQNEPLAKIDKINRARVLLFDEICSQSKEIELIANIQDYLNDITNDNNVKYIGLSNKENFLLYIYTNLVL